MAILYGRADTEKRLLDKLPNRVQKIEDIPKVHREMKAELESMDTGGFIGKIKGWNKKRQINKITENRNSPLRRGVTGELKVLDMLSRLNDDYHVFCGVNIGLPYYVTYNGRKNLRSAQMDFVVVCPKGVFMIEVKNWSKGYAKRHDALNPYEQTDRADRVLWIFLQSWRHKPRVTNVLLSTQGTFEYNKNYRAVFVSSLDRINNFIENREDSLYEKHARHVIKKLEGRVTK